MVKTATNRKNPSPDQFFIGTKTVVFSVLLLFLLTSSVLFSQVEITYKFKPGATYEYEFTSRALASASGLSFSSSSDSETITGKFALKIIDFQEDSFIVDIYSDGVSVRRYLRQNGKISGAPGESGMSAPFFISFPSGLWQINQLHRVNRNFNIGNTLIPASFDSILRSVNTSEQTAQIQFQGQASLPSDQVRKKQFSINGKAVYNLAEGVLQQAEWISDYKFSFANKEFAVQRNLWNFDKSLACTLRLVNIKE